MKDPAASQLFDFFNSFENCHYMPELGLWFVRTMVMCPKNRRDNHWALTAQHWNKQTNMGYICCEAYVMADVYLACHVGFYLFEVVHYVKFQPNLIHWVV
jgi:hypothetical protein